MGEMTGVRKIKNLSKSSYIDALNVLIESKRVRVRSVDLADYLGMTKGGISRAVARLTADGVFSMDEYGFLSLTEEGKNCMAILKQRKDFFHRLLTCSGVEVQKAEKEAKMMAYVIGDRAFELLSLAENKAALCTEDSL